MAFLVEDGSGIAGANAYVAIQDFIDYWSDRGVEIDPISDNDRASIIIRATDYIDKRFGKRFRGFKKQHDQGLEWPRLDAEDDSGYEFDGVPKELQHACIEYALRAFYAVKFELSPDPALPFPTRDTLGTGSTEAAGFVKEKSEKVGPIEEKTKLAEPKDMALLLSGTSTVPGLYIPAYPAADMLISRLLKSGTTVDMERA